MKERMIGARRVYPVLRPFPIWRFGEIYDKITGHFVRHGWVPDRFDVREVEEPVTVNVSDLVRTLCERLGVDPTSVYRIDLETQRATIYRYANNAEGRKYVVKDPESPYFGEAATEPPLVRRIIA
jgi:hypothetical protein